MINNEKGQALPLVLIVIALGALVIPPFLNNTSASLIGSKTYAQAIYSQYAADSGAEHAIWDLKSGDLSGALVNIGDNVSYVLEESINGLPVNVTVFKTAEPDFYEITSYAGNTDLNASVSANSSTAKVWSWYYR